MLNNTSVEAPQLSMSSSPQSFRSTSIDNNPSRKRHSRGKSMQRILTANRVVRVADVTRSYMCTADFMKNAVGRDTGATSPWCGKIYSRRDF